MQSEGSLAGFESVDAILKVIFACKSRSATAAPAVPLARAAHPHAFKAPRGAPQEYLPEDKLREVQRVLHGYNGGKPVEALPLSEELKEHASQQQFDLQAYSIKAAPEQLREPRVVRLGLIQNKIVLPTTAPYAAQKQVGRAVGGARPVRAARRRAGAAAAESAAPQPIPPLSRRRPSWRASASCWRRRGAAAPR
jgi:hypothetical protein